jgi:hypothetical protein
VLQPEDVQRTVQLELLAQEVLEPLVPLLRVQVLAERGEVQHGNRAARLGEAGRGADHEGALPHLARGEHVAVLAPRQRVEKLAVRPPLHVTGRVARQGAAGDVEGASLALHGASP